MNPNANRQIRAGVPPAPANPLLHFIRRSRVMPPPTGQAGRLPYFEPSTQNAHDQRH